VNVSSSADIAWSIAAGSVPAGKSSPGAKKR